MEIALQFGKTSQHCAFDFLKKIFLIKMVYWIFLILCPIIQKKLLNLF